MPQNYLGQQLGDGKLIPVHILCKVPFSVEKVPPFSQIYISENESPQKIEVYSEMEGQHPDNWSQSQEGSSQGYIMGQFDWQFNTLRRCHGPSKVKHHFFDTFTKEVNASRIYPQVQLRVLYIAYFGFLGGLDLHLVVWCKFVLRPPTGITHGKF